MKKLPLILAIFSVFVLISCTAEITIKDTAQGVELSFNGAAEKGFEKLINSMGAENQAFIDPVQITDELVKEGFSNVKVSQTAVSDLSISMLSKDFNNFLFKSGVLRSENKFWVTDFSKEKLLAFYAMSDSQIVQVLDLLLAPVFNDEEMTVEEYLEVIASFYGDSVAEELAESKIKIISKNNAVNTKVYSLPEILCGLAD